MITLFIIVEPKILDLLNLINDLYYLEILSFNEFCLLKILVLRLKIFSGLNFNFVIMFFSMKLKLKKKNLFI